MSEQESGGEAAEPEWLAKLKKASFYIVAAAVGGLLVGVANFADVIGKIYDRFKTPEAFVLAENTAKSAFSDQLAQRAWRRLFWADNFRARVVNLAPIADIDASWKAYIDADADWNANIMISIVGLDHYYDAKRADRLEGLIQTMFSQLDEQLAELRRSDVVVASRAGGQPDIAQRSEAARLAKKAGETSDALKRELYIMVRCFPSGTKESQKEKQNLCR